MLLVAVAFAMQSCVKDLQDDIQDGGWNHERSIISIAFENQIGNASIDNVDAETGENRVEHQYQCPAKYVKCKIAEFGDILSIQMFSESGGCP